MQNETRASFGLPILSELRPFLYPRTHPPLHAAASPSDASTAVQGPRPQGTMVSKAQRMKPRLHILGLTVVALCSFLVPPGFADEHSPAVCRVLLVTFVAGLGPARFPPTPRCLARDPLRLEPAACRHSHRVAGYSGRQKLQQRHPSRQRQKGPKTSMNAGYTPCFPRPITARGTFRLPAAPRRNSSEIRRCGTPATSPSST